MAGLNIRTDNSLELLNYYLTLVRCSNSPFSIVEGERWALDSDQYHIMLALGNVRDGAVQYHKLKVNLNLVETYLLFVEESYYILSILWKLNKTSLTYITYI